MRYLHRAVNVIAQHIWVVEADDSVGLGVLLVTISLVVCGLRVMAGIVCFVPTVPALNCVVC